MQITDIQSRQNGAIYELSARIELGSQTHSVWFRWPGPGCPTPGDVFLLISLLPAMTQGGALRIEATVSERLMKAVPAIQKFFLKIDRALHSVDVLPRSICAWPTDLPTPRSADPSAGGDQFLRDPLGGGIEFRRVPSHGGAACTFTGGVDSFYSTLVHLTELERLIFVHGYDIPLSHDDFRRQVSTALGEAAGRLGKPLIEIEINLRDFSDRWINWELLFGAAIAAVGVLLTGVIRVLYLPSSFFQDRLIECGSHPDLDPLFGTERLDVIHDASRVNRIEKIAAISQSAIAMQTLRVCWENRQGAYNCGQCEKCLRTGVALRIVGARDRCATFPPSSNLIGLLKNVHLHELVRPLWFENLSAALDQGSDAELIAVLKKTLRRSYPGAYLLWRWKRLGEGW